MTQGDEIHLIRRGKRGDWAALAALANSYRGRIAALAARRASPNRVAKLRGIACEPALSRSDLESEGKIALLEAVLSFDEELSAKFSTYAHSQIEGAMKKAVDRWRPKVAVRNSQGYEVLRVQNARLAEGAHMTEIDRAEESAFSSGMLHEPDVAPVRTHRRRHREELALRTPSSCVEARERLQGRPRPTEKLLGVCEAWKQRRNARDLTSALTVLRKREREFLDLWRAMEYGEKRQTAIAAEMDITDSWASKIKTRLLTKLERELLAVLRRPARIPQPLASLPPDVEPRLPLGSMWQWQIPSETELVEALLSYNWGEDKRCLRLSARPVRHREPPGASLFSPDVTFRVFRQNAEIDRIRIEIGAAREAAQAHR